MHVSLDCLNTDKVLIFGGPYSNLAATCAMQETAKALNIKAAHTICTGDLVAYCAEPVETIELIRDWGIPVVMGNCEESLAFEADDCGCGFDAESSCSVLSVTWYRYANGLVNREQRQWMAALPRSIGFSFAGFNFYVIHAGVHSINQFVFESDSRSEKLAQIKQSGADVVIAGHSAIPFGQQIEDKFWLNAGVIGMPANDGTTDVWYMLLDKTDSGFTASWHRLAYDFRKSLQSTNDAGMHEYAKALGDGLWPSMDILPTAAKQRRGGTIQLAPIHAR